MGAEDKPGMEPVFGRYVGVGGGGGWSEAGGLHWQSGFNKTTTLHDRSSFIRCQVSVIRMVMERPGGSFSQFLFYKLGNTRPPGDESAAAWRTSSVPCGKFCLKGENKLESRKLISLATRVNDKRVSAPLKGQWQDFQICLKVNLFVSLNLPNTWRNQRSDLFKPGARWESN